MAEPIEKSLQPHLQLIGTFPMGEQDELPANPSLLTPAEFTLVLTGYDIINLWDQKFITKEVALLLVLNGIREAYREDGQPGTEPLKIEKFDCTTFSRNWETAMDGKGDVKRFTVADVVKMVEKLSQSGAGQLKTSQLSLEIAL